MAEHEHHEDHGHSVAAWSGVTIILIGSAVASLAVVLARPFLFWVGIAVCLVASSRPAPSPRNGRRSPERAAHPRRTDR